MEVARASDRRPIRGRSGADSGAASGLVDVQAVARSVAGVCGPGRAIALRAALAGSSVLQGRWVGYAGCPREYPAKRPHRLPWSFPQPRCRRVAQR